MAKAIMIKQVQPLGRRIEELEAVFEKHVDTDELETFRETIYTARIMEVTSNNLAVEVRVGNSLSMVKKRYNTQLEVYAADEMGKYDVPTQRTLLIWYSMFK